MLSQKLSKYSIILGSASPRRQQFFKDLQLNFSIQVKEVDEVYPAELQGSEITDYLADLKSKAFTNLGDNELVITSDTIVWLENKALEKPKNEAEAFFYVHAIHCHWIVGCGGIGRNNRAAEGFRDNLALKPWR